MTSHSAATLKRLRYNVLLETLSEEEFHSIEGRFEQRQYAQNGVIVEDETIGNEVFFLVEGRVKISKVMQNGEEQILAVLHPGDCFGEMELVSGRPRSARVAAFDACTVFTLGKKVFIDILDRSHPFAIRLLQVLTVRARSMNYHFVRETNKKLERAARELRKFEQLIDATKKVNSTLNLDELLDIILRMALRIVDGDRGTVYLVDEAKQQLWTKVSQEQDGEGRVTIHTPIGKGISGYVAATGDTINIPDAYFDPRFNPDFDKLTGYRTSSILCMPMRNKEDRIIGVFQLLNKRKGVFTEDDATFIDALSVHASLAIENARLYEQEREKIRIERDLLAAREVQMSLLPKTLPSIAGYEFAAVTIPAQQVAGDLYDFLRLDDRHIAVCLGDVSGKGLPASLLMANIQATLRDQARATHSVRECINRTNRLLFQSSGPEKFATLFFGTLDFKDHLLCFSNAGHEQPFLIMTDNRIVRLATGGIVLGILDEYSYKDETVSIEPGAVVVVYSDGITDAINEKQERFGEERLERIILQSRHQSAAFLKQEIVDAVNRHADGASQMDDITLVVLKRLL